MKYSKLFSLLLIALISIACSRQRTVDILEFEIYLETAEFVTEVSYTGSLSNLKDIVIKCDMSASLFDVSNSVVHDPIEYQNTFVSFSWTLCMYCYRSNGNHVEHEFGYWIDHLSIEGKSLTWEDEVSILEIMGDQDDIFWDYLESNTVLIECGITCNFYYSWAESDDPDAFGWSRSVDNELGIAIE